MVRYFYAWAPLFIVGGVAFLALPWLGVFALLFVALVALPALALAVVLVPYLLIQAINRRLHAASRQTVAALAPATRPVAVRKGYVA